MSKGVGTESHVFKGELRFIEVIIKSKNDVIPKTTLNDDLIPIGKLGLADAPLCVQRPSQFVHSGASVHLLSPFGVLFPHPGICERQPLAKSN